MNPGQNNTKVMDMAKLTSTEWSLAARPVGMPKLSDFQTKTIDVPAQAEGEI